MSAYENAVSRLRALGLAELERDEIILPLMAESRSAALREAADVAEDFPHSSHEPDYSEGYADGRRDAASQIRSRAEVKP